MAKSVSRGAHRSLLVPVVGPYRLDLTVAVLRRFSTNVVDVVGPGGTYVRVHATPRGPRAVAVRQRDPSTLEVVFASDDDPERVVAHVRRTLGTEHFAAHFDRAAGEIAWLAGIVERMRGVRSPRYASLWEACVNAVVFQQISLHAATAILGRVIECFGYPFAAFDVAVRSIPEPHEFLDASDDVLGVAGLTTAKMGTLRRIARAIEEGALDEATLEVLPSPQASARLCEIKGVGPWTAAVVLLRGLGRLDVFPENDSGVARNLKSLGDVTIDVADTLARLAPEQGMLYYHLLLARLEAVGEVT